MFDTPALHRYHEHINNPLSAPRGGAVMKNGQGRNIQREFLAQSIE